MTTPNEVTSSLKMYGKMLTFTRIKLETADLTEVEAYLAANLTHKNSQIPVIIDSEVEQDLNALIDLFWSWGLQPIGVVTGILDEAAKALRLAIFPADGKRIELVRPAKRQASPINSTAQAIVNTSTETNNEATSQTQNANQIQAPESETNITSETGANFDIAETSTTLFYDQMLRSGQSINHVGGDLVITHSVNNGSEAITDNSLHVYGRAQGRLVAGATGDKDARIFCQRFNPSLVSVAGTYCLNDSIPADMIDKPVQVRFVEGEGLVFEIINGN
ncbi:septum site-determining protein MinC [Psychrobacter sp.]|uniref:septum site-determining protein MinC n=1 Tax=Psychrobacter sp. TaxID=56811 RepID=UPI0025F0F1A2|nr:septum site-determining protein MinC [Psychrobacter sp.]